MRPQETGSDRREMGKALNSPVRLMKHLHLHLLPCAHCISGRAGVGELLVSQSLCLFAGAFEFFKHSTTM